MRTIPQLALLIITALLLTASSTHAADPADQYPGINLIPWPKTIHIQDGYLNINEQTRIVVDDDLKPLGQMFSDELALLMDKRLPVVSGPAQAGDIVLHINNAIKADAQIISTHGNDVVHTTNGAYTISIDDKAMLEGFDYRAVVEGTATLLQALQRDGQNFRYPKLTIKDWPEADFCGMMIDVARQYHPVDMLKKMIEVCRLYKVRYMQLHMTDDQAWTFPSTKYPQLGSQNGSAHGGIVPKVYTLDELKDLVAYADARGIAIIPELEVPGHSGAALRSLPEIFDGIDPATGRVQGLGCMNMANEAIYPALDTIIGEMCDVFKSSPYIHIGSDEVSDGRVALYSGYPAFMKKHGLKNDGDLETYFIRQVVEIVKKHGKKAIKWEGMGDGATKDAVIMCWISSSNQTISYISQGYSTITCPWAIGVPWEKWSMYVEDNGGTLKKGDSDLGAILVAWEQSAEFQLHSVHLVAFRQERTWGPDNTPTSAGFNVRFQANDAVVNKLLQMPPKMTLAATFENPAGIAGFQGPEDALDGNDDSFYLAARSLKAGESFTIKLDKPQSIYGIEILTGANGRSPTWSGEPLQPGAKIHGLFSGDLQVASDGDFQTVAKFTDGNAKVTLTHNHVKSIRLLATADLTEPLALDEVKLQMLTELSGNITDPNKIIGAGNIGVVSGNATFSPSSDDIALPVLVKGGTLRFDSDRGYPLSYSGAIMGTGKIELYMGNRNRNPDSALTLSGKIPNTFSGTYSVKQGRVALAKDDGVDAIAGDIIVGGQGDNDGLFWGNSNEIKDTVSVTLLDSPTGGASLKLNGFSEKFASLTLGSKCKVYTDGTKIGGVLTVSKLIVNGRTMPDGIYSQGVPWVQGSGFVMVGNVKYIDLSGKIANANQGIASNSFATLKTPTELQLTGDNFNTPIKLNGLTLTLSNDAAQPVQYSGLITGPGAVEIQTPRGNPHSALEFSGLTPNTYQGSTHLIHGVLKLNKAEGAIAIPGNLYLGGNDSLNNGDSVVWVSDGQITSNANVVMTGTQPCSINLDSHHVSFNKLELSAAARIITSDGGALKVHQIFLDGKPIVPGVYNSTQSWIQGPGNVTVDPRVDIKGGCGNPDAMIGCGNIANLTGDATFGYPWGGGVLDIITNGFTVTFESGGGNAFAYWGSISGTGNVVFRMGPSSTNCKDDPMHLAGDKPNTTTGKFIADKGRVQLEKPRGVDAISGDVIVGGQGFNDCLYWKNSDQIKDSCTITMLDTPSSGAAYLNLNGCTETVAGLIMTSNNLIKTDGDDGKGGVLTVKSLLISGKKQPPGDYTSANAKWVQGTGKVVVLH